MFASAPCLSLSKPHRTVPSKLQNLAQCLCGFREDKYQPTSLLYPFSASHRKPYTQKVIQKPQRQSCSGRWLAGDLLQKVDSSHRTSHLEGHTDLTSSNRCLALASTAFSACAFSPCTHIHPAAAFPQHWSPLSLSGFPGAHHWDNFFDSYSCPKQVWVCTAWLGTRRIPT